MDEKYIRENMKKIIEIVEEYGREDDMVECLDNLAIEYGHDLYTCLGGAFFYTDGTAEFIGVVER